MKFIKATPLDKEFVSGIGRIEFETDDKSQTAKLSLEYLKKIFKIVEQLNFDAVYITVQNDLPILIRTNKDDDIGFVISPRIDKNE